MSSDNYFIIRRHPEGGFAAVMGLASDETPTVNPVHHKSFPTIRAAVEYADSQYSKYDTSVHPECDMVAVDSKQLEAMFRLLIDDGHMTPVARMQLRKLFDYKERR